MARRKFRVQSDVDSSGAAAAFVLGAIVGLVVTYPALPDSLQSWQFTGFGVQAGSVSGALIGGLALFLLFVIGILFLNWLFIQAD